MNFFFLMNNSFLSRRQGGNVVMCLFFNLVTQLPSHLVHKLHPSSDDFQWCLTISLTHEFISWTFPWLESPFTLHKHSHTVNILVTKINLYLNFILYFTFHIIECVIDKHDTHCKTWLSPISINTGWKVTMAFQQTLKIFFCVGMVFKMIFELNKSNFEYHIYH
jgi:hypothetical protein